MIDENGRPAAAGRDYDRAEIALDAVVHGIGVVLGVVGAAVLIAFALRSPAIGDLPVAAVYATGLLAMLCLSAAYNLWPVSRIKWVLRRFDHSAIYLLIAATYTPFIAQMKNSLLASALLVGVWIGCGGRHRAEADAAGALRPSLDRALICCSAGAA